MSHVSEDSITSVSLASLGADYATTDVRLTWKGAHTNLRLSYITCVSCRLAIVIAHDLLCLLAVPSSPAQWRACLEL
jgi:hypothetical protein